MAKHHESEKREHEEHEREHRARGGRAHETHGGMREASDGKELETMGEMPGHPHEGHGGKAHKEPEHEKGRHHRRRRGGKAEEGGDGEPAGGGKLQVYNAKDSKEVEDAEDEKPGFKRGGHRMRAGGHAEGHMEGKRLDRRPRRAAGGRAADHSPYSSGASVTAPANDKPGRGYEGTPRKT